MQSNLMQPNMSQQTVSQAKADANDPSAEYVDGFSSSQKLQQAEVGMTAASSHMSYQQGNVTSAQSHTSSDQVQRSSDMEEMAVAASLSTVYGMPGGTQPQKSLPSPRQDVTESRQGSEWGKKDFTTPQPYKPPSPGVANVGYFQVTIFNLMHYQKNNKKQTKQNKQNKKTNKQNKKNKQEAFRERRHLHVCDL